MSDDFDVRAFFERLPDATSFVLTREDAEKILKYSKEQGVDHPLVDEITITISRIDAEAYTRGLSPWGITKAIREALSDDDD